MLLKKSELKKTIVTVTGSLIVLTALTGAFKVYHDSKYEKAEYDRNCPQNYGDPISLARCYWPYKFEGNTLNTALEIETISIFVAPVLIYIAALL